jgi:hypothetical protein
VRAVVNPVMSATRWPPRANRTVRSAAEGWGHGARWRTSVKGFGKAAGRAEAARGATEAAQSTVVTVWGEEAS